MFVEPKVEKGWLEVICGSMFSGKTEELIRRVKRAKIANQKVKIFKPMIDQRYHRSDVVSHDSNSIESFPVNKSEEIMALLGNADVVGIDEAQFFDNRLPEVCNQLVKRKIRVIVAGLDMDFKAQPFGPMPSLLCQAQYVTKVHAICMKCGDVASYTFKKIHNDQTVELGERELYEARCRSCYDEGMATIKEQIKMDL
ncbi:MAG: thymidine kinase [Flavobacteriales bacterium]|nr:thymidine kinase [Flavobacteriales bacterium]